MVSCVAHGCKNRSGVDKKRSKKLSFFRFPSEKDRERRQAWINALRREKWTPTKYSFLCSDHFTPNQIESTYVSGPRLKPESIPNVFDAHPYKKPKKVVAAEQRVDKSNPKSCITTMPAMEGDSVTSSKKVTQSCSVGLCSNYYKPGSTFHRFPRDLKMRRKWEAAFKMSMPASDYMRVCAEHFLPSDYFPRAEGVSQRIKYLRKNAIPSQKLPTENVPLSKQRKGRLRLIEERLQSANDKNVTETDSHETEGLESSVIGIISLKKETLEKAQTATGSRKRTRRRNKEMPTCCAAGCGNSSEHGYVLKRFPRDPKLQKEWAKRVNGPDWQPTSYSHLCEVHFSDKMWEKTQVADKKILIPNAIPTLNLQKPKKAKNNTPIKESPKTPRTPGGGARKIPLSESSITQAQLSKIKFQKIIEKLDQKLNSDKKTKSVEVFIDLDPPESAPNKNISNQQKKSLSPLKSNSPKKVEKINIVKSKSPLSGIIKKPVQPSPNNVKSKERVIDLEKEELDSEVTAVENSKAGGSTSSVPATPPSGKSSKLETYLMKGSPLTTVKIPSHQSIDTLLSVPGFKVLKRLPAQVIVKKSKTPQSKKAGKGKGAKEEALVLQPNTMTEKVRDLIAPISAVEGEGKVSGEKSVAASVTVTTPKKSSIGAPSPGLNSPGQASFVTPTTPGKTGQNMWTPILPKVVNVLSQQPVKDPNALKSILSNVSPTKNRSLYVVPLKKKCSIRTLTKSRIRRIIEKMPRVDHNLKDRLLSILRGCKLSYKEFERNEDVAVKDGGKSSSPGTATACAAPSGSGGELNHQDGGGCACATHCLKKKLNRPPPRVTPGLQVRIDCKECTDTPTKIAPTTTFDPKLYNWAKNVFSVSTVITNVNDKEQIERLCQLVIESVYKLKNTNTNGTMAKIEILLGQNSKNNNDDELKNEEVQEVSTDNIFTMSEVVPDIENSFPDNDDHVIHSSKTETSPQKLSQNPETSSQSVQKSVENPPPQSSRLKMEEPPECVAVDLNFYHDHSYLSKDEQVLFEKPNFFIKLIDADSFTKALATKRPVFLRGTNKPEFPSAVKIQKDVLKLRGQVNRLKEMIKKKNENIEKMNEKIKYLGDVVRDQRGLKRIRFPKAKNVTTSKVSVEYLPPDQVVSIENEQTEEEVVASSPKKRKKKILLTPDFEVPPVVSESSDKQQQRIEIDEDGNDDDFMNRMDYFYEEYMEADDLNEDEESPRIWTTVPAGGGQS